MSDYLKTKDRELAKNRIIANLILQRTRELKKNLLSQKADLNQSEEKQEEIDNEYVDYLADRSIDEIAEAMDVIRHEIGQAEFDKWAAHVDQYDNIEEALENAPADQEVLIKLLKLFDEKQQNEIAQREEQEGDDGFGYDDQEGKQDGTGEAGADNGIDGRGVDQQDIEEELPFSKSRPESVRRKAGRRRGFEA